MYVWDELWGVRILIMSLFDNKYGVHTSKMEMH